MKIAIITQPLESNYGGLLQNYALQQILKKMGHSPITFDQTGWIPPFIIRLKIVLKSLCELHNPFRLFVKKYIVVSSKAKSISDFKKFEKKYKPDAYIVGSDQVWRPKYNILLDSCFLTFTNSKKKIAYAASFGTDNWEYTDQATKRYATYLKSFQAISVREQSAATLCKEYFGINAQLVLDPTLLLEAKDYQELCIPTNEYNPYVFTYILDSADWKQKMVKEFCDNRLCKEVSGFKNMNGDIVGRLTVEEWISYLKNASFVICDSFHGMVFSILMHRPFVVLANAGRGNTRLSSLLERIGLSNRLFMGYSDITELPEINWQEIDDCLNTLRCKSILFIKESLAYIRC